MMVLRSYYYTISYYVLLCPTYPSSCSAQSFKAHNAPEKRDEAAQNGVHHDSELTLAVSKEGTSSYWSFDGLHSRFPKQIPN